MKKINIFLILFVMISTTSCQSIKNAVSGVKQENSDEFLVQKKNPLVLPPNYMELPKPKDDTLEDEITKINEETDIKKILDIETSSSNSQSTGTSRSIEDFVLKKIK